MDSKKILLRYFLFFFILFFLIFNWGKISWIFSPDYVLRVISFYFFEKPKENLSTTTPQITPPVEEILTSTQKEEIFYVDKEDSIEIPKIQIIAPLVLVEKESEVKKALDRGVVLWPSSAFPGEKGQTIILGHSAPPNWPKIKYDWVFSNLNLLEKNDEIIVYFKKRKFVFLVEEKTFVNRGQELPKTDSEKSTLFLISCWPPGKDYRRIIVQASLE